MLDTSFVLLAKYVLINIFLPFLYWSIFIWLIFNDKFKWFLFYIFSWFSGIFIISFLVFDLNFIIQNIYPYNLLISLVILLILLLIKFFIKKVSIKNLFNTLKLNFNILEIKQSFSKLTLIEKVFTFFFSLFLVLYLWTWFVFVSNLPSFADDTFVNWNNPSINMYYDNKIIFFWDKDEILGKWRLGYPIYIPLYKTIIAKLSGIWSDIYINLFNYLTFIFFILFVIYITYNYTKNLFYSFLSAFLITSLPLVFYHSVSGYMDLYSAITSTISIYLLFSFLNKKDYDYLVLAIFFLIWLSYIKNDWFIIYMPWIIFAFFIILFLKKQLKDIFKYIIKNKKLLIISIIFFLFFFLPFLAIKKYYNLWFNQAAGVKSWIWLEWPHLEIFKVFPYIFLNENNYWLVLLWILLLGVISFLFIRNTKYSYIFILLSVIFIFILFNLAFLFTANYKWVLDQTTVNRVFTMVFVIMFSFIGLIINEYVNNKKNI